MKRIEGRAKTIRELLAHSKYTIDFYQREYAWQERQVRELIDDLTGKFIDFYDAGHERYDVKDYGHYFLGPVVVSHKNAKRYIVDGQQRLTTLTLLLIFLNHRQHGNPSQVELASLVYSEEYGKKSFNLDVPERNTVMDRLLHGEAVNLDDATESVANIAARYDNIAEHFPDDIDERALPYFLDWFLNNVHLVEIEAYSDEDAYTIFETMNDRGLSLSLPEMLKGYVLANIRHEGEQRQVNTLWKDHMQAFKDLGEEEDVDFFKNWLRSQHAETIRQGKKGAENRDFERIGSEFHRWIRDKKEELDLKDSAAFVRFVSRDLDFYAKQTQRIRKAAHALTPGLEAIRYNEERGFTLQTQVLLAALSPEDSADVVTQKLRLVADFLDIWLARRVWNFRTVAYSSVRYGLFTMTKAVRRKSPSELVSILTQLLDEQPERFVTQPKLRLHGTNYRQIRHVLARLTNWVDTQCGLDSHFDDLVSAGRAKPYEIEHLWAAHYDRFDEVFATPAEFEVERGRLGGLVLLQRGLNQSLGDKTYEDKVQAYAVHSNNLLARSLNPMAYESSPAFRQLRERTGLAFKPYEHFGPEEQAERQELYIRIAEWVWNPGRITLGDVAAPVHEPLPEHAAPKETVAVPLSARHATRRRFWTQLLEVAVVKSPLHKNTSAGTDSWCSAGAGRTGLSFNYNVTMEQTRVELYIGASDKALNKALFDQLHSHRGDVRRQLVLGADGRPQCVSHRISARGGRLDRRVDLGRCDRLDGGRDDPTAPGARASHPELGDPVAGPVAGVPERASSAVIATDYAILTGDARCTEVREGTRQGVARGGEAGCSAVSRPSQAPVCAGASRHAKSRQEHPARGPA